jgi:hypothetical protein
MKHMENILSTWIEDQNLRHRPVSKFLVQGKARSVCEDLEDLWNGDYNVKQFSLNMGWFTKFTKRQNFHNIEMSGEAVSAADTVAAE